MPLPLLLVPCPLRPETREEEQQLLMLLLVMCSLQVGVGSRRGGKKTND
jgi:hypothetical protein